VSLLLRVNLVFVALAVCVGAAAGYACRAILEGNAQRELLGEASMLLDGAVATRSYTANEIEPLLREQLKTDFLPQTIPFYAATQNFLKLHEKFPQYAYKEATLNPTNPRDRAADWEADIIQRFRTDAGARQISGVRDTPMGPSLYLARPIHVDAECLACHGRPANAPATLIARYGSDNGFGWQANEIVGAQVVSVPSTRAEANVDRSFGSFMLIIGAALATFWLATNVLLHWLVLRPLRRIATLADTLSLGKASSDEFPTRGAGEIRALGAAFNRMRNSLAKAMQLLGG
jgi:protein-histidine pros-kinase